MSTVLAELRHKHDRTPENSRSTLLDLQGMIRGLETEMAERAAARSAGVGKAGAAVVRWGNFK